MARIWYGLLGLSLCHAIGCASAGGEAEDDMDAIDAAPGFIDAKTVTDGMPPNKPDASNCTGKFYSDADKDGHGTGAAVTACTAPTGFVVLGDDCDDTRADRYPGNIDVCDGIDNDCNAGTGETCAAECTPTMNGPKVYLFCTGDSNWSTAESVCAGANMRLVQLNDAAENAWVRSTADAILGTNDFFIGASDAATEDTWVWDDGPQFWQGRSNGTAVGGLYTNWDGGEPNDDKSEDCAEMQGDGQWNDVPCGSPQEFVCERD
jgi:hypothetical protein